MTKNIYVLGEKEFYSIKALASHVNINEKTLTARLRRGMTVEEACRQTDLRCTYHMYADKKMSVAQICRVSSKNEALIRNRLKYGYSMNDALNTPKKISRQGRPIIVKGILYNSTADAIRNLNLQHKEATIKGRLYRGMKPDEAFLFDD